MERSKMLLKKIHDLPDDLIGLEMKVFERFEKESGGSLRDTVTKFDPLFLLAQSKEEIRSNPTKKTASKNKIF